MQRAGIRCIKLARAHDLSSTQDWECRGLGQCPRLGQSPRAMAPYWTFHLGVPLDSWSVPSRENQKHYYTITQSTRTSGPIHHVKAVVNEDGPVVAKADRESRERSTVHVTRHNTTTGPSKSQTPPHTQNLWQPEAVCGKGRTPKRTRVNL